jgi:putative polyketide hydroxylase
VARTAPWLKESQAPEAIVDDLQIELGYLYDSPQGSHADPRTTRGLPGSRAPHLWLTRSGQSVSTIDLVGNHVLFAGADGGRWVRAAAEVAAEFAGIPIDSYCVGKDLGDPQGRFADSYGISAQGASLVRPDGFIAWRSPGPAADCASALAAALAQSLGV